jgi:glycyl-tRNA synthetase beta chain
MASFLFEIGLEEVPARMLQSAQQELIRRVEDLFLRERLLDSGHVVTGYSTPRRLAVRAWEVKERQEDIVEEILGPSSKIAFRDGVAGPAAIAFAKKAGVAVESLKTVSTPKGDYVAATSVKRGRSASEVIAEELPKELAGIYWAKTMYWRPGKPERFVRPVQWMVALLDGAIVPVRFAGYEAGRLTYGHRILYGLEPFSLAESWSYHIEMKKVFVEVHLRKDRIRKDLDSACRTLAGTRWREDHDLVDKMTNMTEWPSVIAGNFDPEFLALPEEVLVTVMRDHQNYFAVETSDGKLAPHFLAVLNIALDEVNGPIIKQGNERVLKARFNDARFFWEFDQRVPLVERVKLLENVTFQKDLGSYAAKSERVGNRANGLAAWINQHGGSLDTDAIDEAAILAKTDLTTELVKEFTELQGVIGGLYATSQGISATAAEAIYDQYLPASAKDGIPRSAEGCILGLADRIDTIAGMFGLGLEPTGSKDPFALRRAANAIVRILAESELPLLLSDVLNCALDKGPVYAKLEGFFAERIDFYLREGRGQSYDVVKAVMSAGSDDIRDLVARAEAVTAVRGSEDFLAVSASFKRMKNILAQASAKGDTAATTVDHDLLVDPSEKLLAVTANASASAVEKLQAERKYVEALRIIASLRPNIDAFFEDVMVMAPEQDIRANRLALLARTLGDFSKIADFSEIVTAG